MKLKGPLICRGSLALLVALSDEVSTVMMHRTLEIFRLQRACKLIYIRDDQSMRLLAALFKLSASTRPGCLLNKPKVGVICNDFVLQLPHVFLFVQCLQTHTRGALRVMCVHVI